MKDYELILAEILKLLSKPFTIWGFELNIISILIGTFVLSLVFISIRKLAK